MKKVGQGLSYTVYESQRNKVFKKPTKNIYKFSKLLLWSLWYRKNLSLISKYKSIIYSGKFSIEKLKNSPNINLEIIGNPIFYNSLEYSQDKIIVLKEYFKTHSFKENCLIIDNYVENVFETWKNGFSDVDFNFAMNSGVNKEGKVILADINALSFNKLEISELIEKKIWLNKHSYKYLDDKELQKYFSEIVNEKLTKENLNKYWKNN